MAPNTEPTGLPMPEQLASLPRWARVVFAARCARRVHPLYGREWPSAAASHVDALDIAISLAEYSASVGRVNKVAAYSASRAASVFAYDSVAVYESENHSAAPDIIAAADKLDEATQEAASNAAFSAAIASGKGESAAHEAAHIASQAVNF